MDDRPHWPPQSPLCSTPLPDLAPPDRIGISFGGPVDFPAQRIALSTHAPGWQGFDFAGWLRRLPALRNVGTIVIDNDANAGALGEARFGAASPNHNHGSPALPMFYVTLSTGIGGGLVLQDGEVYRGADSWAGELGHIPLDPNGPECLCGARGCFERMCSGMWLERDHGRPAAELLADDTFLDAYATRVARGLKPVLMLLNPVVVVIGGGIAKTGERLFSRVNRALREQMTDWSGARVHVTPAALGDDSVLWGAYALATTPGSPQQKAPVNRSS